MGQGLPSRRSRVEPRWDLLYRGSSTVVVLPLPCPTRTFYALCRALARTHAAHALHVRATRLPSCLPVRLSTRLLPLHGFVGLPSFLRFLSALACITHRSCHFVLLHDAYVAILPVATACGYVVDGSRWEGLGIPSRSHLAVNTHTPFPTLA
jgi:hypothetical protein